MQAREMRRRTLGLRRTNTSQLREKNACGMDARTTTIDGGRARRDSARACVKSPGSVEDLAAFTADKFLAVKKKSLKP